jgi:hypothetical protein
MYLMCFPWAYSIPDNTTTHCYAAQRCLLALARTFLEVL